MIASEIFCIYTRDGEYVGFAYGRDEADGYIAQGHRARPYLDHVRPECRTDDSSEAIAAEVARWAAAAERNARMVEKEREEGLRT